MRCRAAPVPWCTFRPEQEAPTLWRRIGAQSARATPGSPAIIRHAELQSPKAPFLFPSACTTHLLPRQRIRLALRWVQPARIRVRPALRSRGVRTPLPLSAARTRPGGSREAARRPDGTTTMGRERVPGRGLGDRWQRARLRWGQPAASPGGMSLDTEETAGSPFTIRAPRAAGNRRGNPPWLPDSIHAPNTSCIGTNVPHPSHPRYFGPTAPHY